MGFSRFCPSPILCGANILLDSHDCRPPLDTVSPYQVIWNIRVLLEYEIQIGLQNTNIYEFDLAIS